MNDVRMGFGMMGWNHARVLNSLEEVELAGIADPGGDRFGVAGSAKVIDTVEALIDLGIDAAVVATPTAYHLAAGLELAAAGVHTLVEKPLARDHGESMQLVDAFESAGLINAVGHIERGNPAELMFTK